MIPDAASTFAPLVDRAFAFIFAVTMGMVVLVTVLMVYFAVRYHRSRNPEPTDIPSNLALEITWVVIPGILAMAIFFFGWEGYRAMRTVPPGAMPVRVIAEQWAWHFEYPNGKTVKELRVPVNTPVVLHMTSRDVIHSLYIPAFRVKEDVVPGMETQLWFQADRVGTYRLFCAEYCGAGHSSMMSQVVVLSQDAYRSWYESHEPGEEETTTPVAEGKKLFEDQGCSGCHSVDGLHGIGPTLQSLAGHSVTVTTGGKMRDVVADDAYLRRSILDPEADLVRGFQPIMPAFRGRLSDEEVTQLVAFIKSLKAP